MCHSNKSTLGHAGSAGCFDIFSILACVPSLIVALFLLRAPVTLSISSYTLGQRIADWPLLSEALKHETLCTLIMAWI